MIAFFTLGGSEIIVILFIVLLLFGAKRLPDLARSLGQAKQEFLKATRDLPATLEANSNLSPTPSPTSARPVIVKNTAGNQAG